ncbi:short chain dehydrogenase [Thiotrichales bacterium 19S3-7]|nr:short chain dehydrogenase [Thiotrichales bacterium 19S3-7]MCF6802917.1 short chain dehydrogenase [Thiotrichales bacterium 19S3-11]
MKKVIVVGGTGKIGQAVSNALKEEHEVITAGYSSGDVQVDIGSRASIEMMYKQVGDFDDVVATVGKVKFSALDKMTSEDYQVGLNHKLMGQVNLVLEGIKYINQGGSFTLTSGILNVEPIKGGTSAAMVNSALEGFVLSASYELPNKNRINIVSPTVITEALDTYGEFFKGYLPVAVNEAALAYVKSVDSHHTGRVYRVGF